MSEKKLIPEPSSCSQDMELDYSEGEIEDFSSPEKSEEEVVTVETVDSVPTSEDNIEMYSSSSASSPSSKKLSKKNVQEEVTVYPCAYRKYGCGKSFMQPLDFKEHVQRHCKYSILHACREKKCLGTSNARFETLMQLATHYTDDHNLPDLAAQDDVSTFAVDPDFFEIPMQGVWQIPDVNAKMIAQASVKDNGEEYKVAFMLATSWRGIKDDRVYLLPVTYGQGEQMDHIVEVMCSIGGSGEGFLRMKSGLVDASSTITMCPAVGNVKSFYDHMNTLDHVITFDKQEFIEKGRKMPDGKLAYDIVVDIKTYRVRILRQSGMEPRRYSLTERLLGEEVTPENPCIMRKVITPQLYGDADLIIESHDRSGLFNVLSSTLTSYAIRKRTKEEAGPRKCIGIVMFPTKTLLMNALNAWMEIGTRSGVKVSVLPEYLGSEILLTTTSDLKEALEKKKEFSSDDFLSSLNFVVVYDADHYFVHPSAVLLKQSMQQIEKMIMKRHFIRVAISPVVNQDLISLLNSHGFTFLSNVFSVGIKPDFFISKMVIDFSYEDKFPYKRQALIPIINNNEKKQKIVHLKKKWIVFGESFACDQDELLDDLNTAFRDRVYRVETQEAMELKPEIIAAFLSNPKGILLTGYFALGNDEVTTSGCNVIMFTMPCCKADLRRVSDLVVDNKATRPPLCYGLRDKRARDIMKEGDLFDKQ